MEAHSLFLNDAGRLRSGWRLGIFTIVLIAVLFVISSLVRVVFAIALLANGHARLAPYFADIIFRTILLASALVAGWICNRWLEGLPWRALGLTFHSKWLRDFVVGSLIGVASLALAVLIAIAAGRLRFALTREMFLGVLQRLLSTLVLFIVAALFEESLFRGYPLQTVTRAGLAWFGILITSVVPFAAGHLENPHLTVFSLINTAFAGVWLAIAYLRTRSLWFPLGVHWAWNWAQGSIFGLAVSGVVVSAHQVFQATDNGPAWLTGGTYGIEGGVACTIALLLSILFIWRTRLVSATAELKRLTSQENPRQKSNTLLQTNDGDSPRD